MEYMEKVQYSEEKKLLNDYLLNEFEILGTSDRGGDDYEEIAKIRLTEKKEDSCKIVEREREFENFTNEYLFAVIGIANSARWIGDYECYTKINGRKIYNRILIKRV